MNRPILAIAGACALSLVPACKSAKAQENKPAPAANTAATATPDPAKPTAAPTAATPATELHIESVGNQMKFDKDSLTVKTGAKVHLTFVSHSTLAVMPHNWVLAKPGTEAAVALAGLNKGEAADYVDPGPNVLAHTALANGDKKTVDVTFTAPAPGTYPYICTVPGHYVVMHGKLIVTP
jgi:azurin